MDSSGSTEPQGNMGKLPPAYGVPRHDWQSETSYRELNYPEKPSQARNSKTSKRFVWRVFRLGTSLALTIAALVLTLIILVAGRHGDGGSDLALINIDMNNFARFTPPTIELVHNSTEASKTRRGLGSLVSDISTAAGSAETWAETAAAGAVSAVESAGQAAATAIEAEADKIIDDIGDGLAEIENAVTGLMDKVLDTIQDELNKWLQEAASSLNDLDIPRKMSLHLTTYCSARSTNGSTSNSTQTSCNQLFSSGGADSYNATANNGTIFGFQPGGVIAKALGVFFVPAGAQEDIREPVDKAANTVDKMIQEAGNDLSSWSVDLLFIPIVVVFILAAVFICILLLILIAAAGFSLRAGESLPRRVYSVCGTISAVATFFLFLGSVILTVIGLVAYIVGLGGDVVGVTVSSGNKLKWISWSAFFIMLAVTGTLKVEEFVADCIFWWRFLGKLLRIRKTKGGIREVMKDLK